MNLLWIILIFALAIAGGWLIAYLLHFKKMVRTMGEAPELDAAVISGTSYLTGEHQWAYTYLDSKGKSRHSATVYKSKQEALKAYKNRPEWERSGMPSTNEFPQEHE